MKIKPEQTCADGIAPQLVGANIRDLRRRAHLSQGDLALRLGMRQGPVSNIENGKNLPSASVLMRLAAILNVTVDRILRPDRYVAEAEENPTTTNQAICSEAGAASEKGTYSDMAISNSRAEPVPAHRLAPTSAAAQLGDENPDCRAVESVVRDYLALEDICKAPRQARIPLQLAFDASAPGLVRLAAQIRALLGIGDAVVFDLLELCENHGLRVVFMPMRGAVEHFSFHDAPNGNVFIFIKDSLNPERQLFSLAYEFGRILLYTRAALMGESPFAHESRTNKSARHFAACFLMPENAVRTSVGQTGARPDEWDLPLLLRLKHRFGVSAETFNYRLLELDLITPGRQAELRAEIKAFYEAHAFAEPGNSRRILSPNGRLGDLLHTALRRADPEAAGIAARLKKLKIQMP